MLQGTARLEAFQPWHTALHVRQDEFARFCSLPCPLSPLSPRLLWALQPTILNPEQGLFLPPAGRWCCCPQNFLGHSASAFPFLVVPRIFWMSPLPGYDSEPLILPSTSPYTCYILFALLPAWIPAFMALPDFADYCHYTRAFDRFVFSSPCSGELLLPPDYTPLVGFGG